MRAGFSHFDLQRARVQLLAFVPRPERSAATLWRNRHCSEVLAGRLNANRSTTFCYRTGAARAIALLLA